MTSSAIVATPTWEEIPSVGWIKDLRLSSLFKAVMTMNKSLVSRVKVSERAVCGKRLPCWAIMCVCVDELGGCYQISWARFWILHNLRLIVKLENKTIFKTPDSIAFWLLARSIDQMQRRLSEVQRSEMMPVGLCTMQCAVCTTHYTLCTSTTSKNIH